MLRRVHRFFDIAFVLSLTTAPAWAATPSLTVGSLSGQAGTTVALPMTFDPGASSISALQFSLTLPAGLSTGTIVPGAIVGTAGKIATSSLVGSSWNIIVYGGNAAIPAGTLMTVPFIIAPGTASGPLSISLTGVVYSDPNGSPVAAGTNTSGTVTVSAASSGNPNQAPVVSAGANQAIPFPAAATLNGSATDDGLPNPPGALTLSWSKVSGPGSVTFANASAAHTTATFSQTGTYTLQLLANDGALSNTGTTVVTVNAAASGNTAPALTIGAAAGSAGTSVTLPVTFDPGTSSVSALQFSLTLPAALSTGTITAGAIAGTAGKIVSSNLVGNSLNIIVYGGNTTLAAGSLMSVQLKIAAGTAAGALNVAVSGIVYADPSGTPVAAGTSTNGTVTVGSLAALPAPDVSGIDGKTFGTAAVLSLNYGAAATGFNWEFDANDSLIGAASGLALKPAVAAVPTSAPSVALGGLGLASGSYTLRVQAVNSTTNQSSPWATARITLVDALDGSAVKVYPNPWRKDKHGERPVTFTGVAAGSSVKIFAVSGHLIKTLNESGGVATWDVKTDGGDSAASGIYVYLVGSGSNKTRGKLVVIR